MAPPGYASGGLTKDHPSGVGCKDLGECFAGQAQVFGDRGKCFLQGGVSVRKCFSVPASQKRLFKGAKMTR